MFNNTLATCSFKSGRFVLVMGWVLPLLDMHAKHMESMLLVRLTCFTFVHR